MKHYLLITALLVFTFSACKEKENIVPGKNTTNNPTNPNPPVDNTDRTYIINGLSDITIGNKNSINIPIQLEFVGGQQKKVSLMITGLPKYCYASFSPKAGIPGFATTMSISTTLADPGSYPITLTGLSQDGKTREYNLQLTIVDKLDCDSFLPNAVTKSFTTTKKDSKTVIYSQSNMTSKYDSSTKKNVVMIDNLFMQEDSSGTPFISYNKGLYLITNCAKRTVTVPDQRIQGRRLSSTVAYKDYDMSGTGTIDPEKGTITINYYAQDQNGVGNYYTMTTSINLK